MIKIQINNAKAPFWISTVKQKQFGTNSIERKSPVQIPEIPFPGKVKRRKKKNRNENDSVNIYILYRSPVWPDFKFVPRKLNLVAIWIMRLASTFFPFGAEHRPHFSKSLFHLGLSTFLPYWELTFYPHTLQICLILPENPPPLTLGVVFGFCSSARQVDPLPKKWIYYT